MAIRTVKLPSGRTATGEPGFEKVDAPPSKQQQIADFNARIGRSPTDATGIRFSSAGLIDTSGVDRSAVTRTTVTRPIAEAPQAFTQDDATRIREETRQRQQAIIDRIDMETRRLLREQSGRQEELEGRARGLNVASGLIGGTFGAARAAKTEEFGRQEREQIQNQQAIKVQAALGAIDELAEANIREERTLLGAERESFFAEQEKRITRANELLTILGSQEVDFDAFKDQDPERYQTFLNAGLSDLEIEMRLREANPSTTNDELEFKELKSGVVGFFNKRTGAFKEIEIEGGLDVGEELKVVDGVPYASFTNETGNIELRKIKGFEAKPEKAEKPDFTEAKFIRDLRQEATKIGEDHTEVVRQLNQMEAGLTQAKNVKEGLGTVTTDPVSGELTFTGQSLNAPSQAILVTFQKILDPTSVVRESEYARSEAGTSLSQRIEGRISTWVRGGANVTVKELEEVVVLAREFVRLSANSLQGKLEPIRAQVTDLNLDPSQIFGEVAGTTGTTGTAGEIETTPTPLEQIAIPQFQSPQGDTLEFPNGLEPEEIQQLIEAGYIRL